MQLALSHLSPHSLPSTCPSCLSEDSPIKLRTYAHRLERFSATTEMLLSIPEHVVEELDPQESSVIAVFGAGPDVFASPFAERVGPRGRVYSLELTDQVPKSSYQRSMPGYVKMVHKDNERISLADQSVDLAIWAFAFRTLGHVATMLDETRRVLRPGGRLGVVDWIRQEESCGPRRDDRVSAAMCERCLAAGGFGLVGQRIMNPSHYLVVGRRPMGDAGRTFAAGIRSA